MKINKIEIVNDGYVFCKSDYYTCKDILPYNKFSFDRGINILSGGIDSGIWAVSYLLSMYKHKNEDFILFKEPEVFVNGCAMPLCDLTKYSCYMDESYPLFSSTKNVKFLVEQGIKKNKSNSTSDEIRELFCIDKERFERPISHVGNEIFAVMAAIGYCNEKQIYCFPWMSQQRFKGFHNHITELLEILKNLNLIVVFPTER